MIEGAPAEWVLGIAVIFARVGGVFFIAPGLSSARIPVRIRVFMALALSLALSPLLIEEAKAAVEARAPADLLAVLGTETMIGFLIGFLARLLLMALEFIATGIAQASGLGGIPGTGLEGNEPSPAVATLFTTTAVTIIFLADLHYEILRGMVGSYTVIPAGGALDVRLALVSVSERAGQAFAIALRLGAPFMIYSVIVNFAVGITNKLTPQLPVFFIALPMITAGGLLMMALTIREIMLAFKDAFEQLAFAL
ncbi:MAG: flagellar biosynthetic protein FliR [Pseudomonadota bacterium]